MATLRALKLVDVQGTRGGSPRIVVGQVDKPKPGGWSSLVAYGMIAFTAVVTSWMMQRTGAYTSSALAVAGATMFFQEEQGRKQLPKPIDMRGGKPVTKTPATAGPTPNI